MNLRPGRGAVKVVRVSTLGSGPGLDAALSSDDEGLSDLRSEQPGRRRLLRVLRERARRRDGASRGAQDRHDPVLRHGGVHVALRPGGSGGCPGDARHLPSSRSTRDRALRGHGREVHRRRGHGRLRRPGRARGRRTARALERSSHPTRDRGAERDQPRPTARRPDRDRDGGGGRLRGFGEVRPGHRHRRRGEHGVTAAGRRADRRDPRGRGNASAHEGSVRLRAAGSGPGQGQGRAAAGLGRESGPQPLRRRAPTGAPDAVRRSGGRARAPQAHVRARGPRAIRPARHAARRAGRGQEPHHPRAVLVPRRPARAGGVLAARPVSPVRRGRHVLGAGGDRQGPSWHPRVGRRSNGARTSSLRASPCSSRSRARQSGSVRAWRP